VIFEHLGDIYFEKGESGKAKKAWERSKELDPTNDEVQRKIEKAKEHRR
jgi:predicted negative regulator of RcsB-dependent stress response